MSKCLISTIGDYYQAAYDAAISNSDGPDAVADHREYNAQGLDYECGVLDAIEYVISIIDEHRNADGTVTLSLNALTKLKAIPGDIEGGET